MTPILEAHNLSFAYVRGEVVLTGVDLRVAPGEIVGIVGPNGSGKSTLLRLMGGFLHPDDGHVLLDGSPLEGFSHRERARRVAFLPQAVNPSFSLSVFEVICLGRYPYVGMLGGLTRKDVDRAEECLVLTKTEGLRRRDFMTLSGGERQRVLIASILAQEPNLLLLDEPTAALDIHHQVEIFSLLKKLARDRYGVAVVTHDLNLAARYCDSIVLLSLESGHVIATGLPEEVFTESILSKAYSSAIRIAEHPSTHTAFITADDPEGR